MRLPEQVEKKQQQLLSVAFKNPIVHETLAQMPDLKALLVSFHQHSTIRPFLEKNQVPFYEGDIKKFNFNVRDYLFGSDRPEIGSVLRRATLARWLYLSTDWYGRDQAKIVTRLNECARFICSAPVPRGQDSKVSALRKFLGKVIENEFAVAVQEENGKCDYTLTHVLVSKNGYRSRINTINGIEDIDIAKTFGLYAESDYSPLLFSDLARSYVQESGSRKSLDSLARKLCVDCYSGSYRRRLVYEGLQFLENTLHKYDKSQGWEALLLDRKKKLRQFRELFQENVAS